MNHSDLEILLVNLGLSLFEASYVVDELIVVVGDRGIYTVRNALDKLSNGLLISV